MSNKASIEGLEFMLSDKRKEYYVATHSESRLSDFIKTNCPSDKALFVKIDPLKSKKKLKDIWGDEQSVIKSTDISGVFKKNHIGELFLDEHSSLFMEKWSKKENIKLIVTPWELQRKFENKIFFDDFLRKNGLPVPDGIVMKSEKDIALVNFYPVVLQVPESHGSMGTYFVKTKSGLRKILDEKKLRYPLLCRRYVEGGIPVGVSILIGKENIAISALRVQAYFPEEKKYYGIQWVKTSFFPKPVIDELNLLLKKISVFYRKAGFRGLANFDLIIKNNRIYFLECNPRLGGATAHLSLKKELLHGLCFSEQFAKACSGPDLSKNMPFIPDSRYEGFALDMDSIKPEGLAGYVKTAAMGFYRMKGSSLCYLSRNIDDFDNDSGVFIYHTLPDRLKLPSKRFMGFAILNKPLLKLYKNGYTFSAGGKKFIKLLKENHIYKNCKMQDSKKKGLKKSRP